MTTQRLQWRLQALVLFGSSKRKVLSDVIPKIDTDYYSHSIRKIWKKLRLTQF